MKISKKTIKAPPKERKNTSSKVKSTMLSSVSRKAGKNRYIAGIGASAGGLEALEQFFNKLPINTNLSFVIIQHLDPNHKGMMPELIQRFTKMKVYQVKDRMKVNPNSVYVIPPNKDMSILHGVLYLLEPTISHGLRLPIDFFFRHLAQDQNDKSIGIIFSGMGTDGTLGLKAIKEKMGLILVQDPLSAKYDSMPRSAIDANLVDFISAPEEMAEKLLSIVEYNKQSLKKITTISESSLEAMEKVFILIRQHTGYDFSIYKHNTTFRRIERRMGVHQIDKISNYVRLLQENPQEVDLLFKELLIGVTNFFRDAEAFKELKKEILKILKSDPERKNLRVWVPACSTGEEAYSIAIIIKECLKEIKKRTRCKIEIFATDISIDAIERARLGVFQENIIVDVSSEYLKKYFIKEEKTYRLVKEIREMLIFAVQNVIMDPPFTKIDLLSCRNLLIYLSPEVQKKIIALFHYSLNMNGLLFLGSSETIGAFNDIFTPINNRWKIFKRRETAININALLDFPFQNNILSVMKSNKPQQESITTKKKSIFFADNLFLQAFAPPGVIINYNGDIIYINGKIGKYLEPAAGKADLNIYAMAREYLRYQLAGAIEKAKLKNSDILIKNLEINNDGDFHFINLIVRPFLEPYTSQKLLMVVFENVDTQVKEKTLRKIKSGSSKELIERISKLENDLLHTKKQLNKTMFEMQNSQEELKATNEELQSTNEELQSTNEELSTSKEEMQSLNEELMSVNAELQNKVEELSKTENDMKNLLNSTEIAMLFLDNKLKIRRFTPQTTKIIKLIPGDVGRPVTDITTDLLYESLVSDCRFVLDTLIYKETQVKTKDGRRFSTKIMPYKTHENIIDGVVITFMDNTKFEE